MVAAGSAGVVIMLKKAGGGGHGYRHVLDPISRRGNNGVSRYPRYQKVFGLTENFD